MDRRSFVLSAAALACAGPALAKTQLYTPGMVQSLLASGETVFLEFSTEWCSTCAAQRRVLDKLKAADARYLDAISFVYVDWDKHARSDLAKALRVPRRSTLVVLKGDQELGRIVAGTRERDIKALMDTALNAATTS